MSDPDLPCVSKNATPVPFCAKCELHPAPVSNRNCSFPRRVRECPHDLYEVFSVGSIRFLGFFVWLWVVAFWAFPRVYSAVIVIEDGTLIGMPPEVCQALSLPVENARCKFRGALQGTLRLTWVVVSETGAAVELDQGKYPLVYAKSHVAGGKPTEVALFMGLGILLILPLIPEAVLFLRRRGPGGVENA